MDNSNDTQFETLNIFGELCDAPRLFPDIVSREEAGKVTEVCRHNRELYIRCRDCELDAYLETVQGLDFDTVTNLGRIDLSIPPFIPIIERGFFQSSFDTGTNVVGIQLRHTCSKGDGIRRNVIHESPLLQQKQVIQFSSGRDDLIEPLWDYQDELAWFEAMGTMGLAAATGVNFSDYECMCPFGQHFNLKKSLVSASLMQAAGVPAIPHFYAISQNQRERVVRWLNRRPLVNVISINCQSQRSKHDLRVLKQTIVYILENTNRELHIILEGFRIPWLEGLYPYLPYLHIAQKQPFMDALGYKAVDFDSSEERYVRSQVQGVAQEVLAERNIRARREYIEHLRQRYAGIVRVPPLWLRSNISSLSSIRTLPT